MFKSITLNLNFVNPVIECCIILVQFYSITSWRFKVFKTLLSIYLLFMTIKIETLFNGFTVHTHGHTFSVKLLWLFNWFYINESCEKFPLTINHRHFLNTKKVHRMSSDIIERSIMSKTFKGLNIKVFLTSTWLVRII